MMKSPNTMTMKPLRIILSVVLFALHSMLPGQITITSTDMPAVGDTIRYSNATMTSIMGYSFAATGPNHIWDFSNLAHASQDVDTFVSVLSTSIMYYPSFLTNSNLARKGESFSMANFSLTNVYDFFRKNADNYSQSGFAGTLSGIPLPTVYSSRDYHYRFPMNYGNSDSCEFGYNMGIPGLFTLANQSKRVNTVDGWGTVITPLGTFQALRVKSVITSRDSVASDSLPFPIPLITTVTTEYKWLTNGHSIPLLTATARGIGATTVVYADVYRSTIGITESLATHGKPSVYPNPVSGKVYVATGIPGANGNRVSYTLFDPTGREWLNGEQLQEGGIITLHLAPLPEGLYIVRLLMPDGSSLTSKLVRQN
jgi:hypothetical protein